MKLYLVEMKYQNKDVWCYLTKHEDKDEAFAYLDTMQLQLVGRELRVTEHER